MDGVARATPVLHRQGLGLPRIDVIGSHGRSPGAGSCASSRRSGVPDRSSSDRAQVGVARSGKLTGVQTVFTAWDNMAAGIAKELKT